MSNGILVPNLVYEGSNNEFDYKGFWVDFAIADKFGSHAVKDTFKRAHEAWKDDVQYYASLVLTLNHRLWKHYDEGNMALAKLYDALWKQANSFGYNHFKGDDLLYYDRFLD